MTDENQGSTKVVYQRWEDRHPELFAFFQEYNSEMFIHCLDAKGEPNDFGRLALEHIELKEGVEALRKEQAERVLVAT